jgi:hypothetical protein
LTARSSTASDPVSSSVAAMAKPVMLKIIGAPDNIVWGIAQPDFNVKQGPDLFMPCYALSEIRNWTTTCALYDDCIV